MQTVYIGNTLINDFFLGNTIVSDVLTRYTGFDNDVENFVNASGITNPSTITALDKFVTSLKSNNLWTKLYALYPFVGDDANSNKYNLINTGSYTISFSSGWTFDSNGITGNGTSTFANTNLSSPATNFSGSAAIFNYSRTTGTTGIDIGVQGNNGVYYLANRYTGNLTYFQFEQTATTSASLDGSGLYMGVSSGSSQTVYRNGSQWFTTTKTAALNPDAPFYIGGINFKNIGANDISNRNFAMAGVGNAFNSSQASTFYTIVQNFQTELGRQV